MDKNSPQHREQISFRQLWEMIASNLGDARLDLNTKAKTLNEFINPNSDVCTYLHSLIRESYKANNCQNLYSSVNLETIFDLLGEAAFMLQSKNQCDLFDIELLEEIAWLITDRYQKQVHEMLIDQDIDSKISNKGIAANTPRQSSKKQQRASVISFPRYKIRRANLQQ